MSTQEQLLSLVGCAQRIKTAERTTTQLQNEKEEQDGVSAPKAGGSRREGLSPSLVLSQPACPTGPSGMSPLDCSLRGPAVTSLEEPLCMTQHRTGFAGETLNLGAGHSSGDRAEQSSSKQRVRDQDCRWPWHHPARSLGESGQVQPRDHGTVPRSDALSFHSYRSGLC